MAYKLKQLHNELKTVTVIKQELHYDNDTAKQ